MNKNKWFLKGGRESGRTFRLLCEAYENKIANLQHTHEVSARNMGSFIESLSKSENEAKKQLTKAKEIIKNLMTFAEMDSREYEKEYKEAEQFLKECK